MKGFGGFAAWKQIAACAALRLLNTSIWTLCSLNRFLKFMYTLQKKLRTAFSQTCQIIIFKIEKVQFSTFSLTRLWKSSPYLFFWKVYIWCMYTVCVYKRTNVCWVFFFFWWSVVCTFKHPLQLAKLKSLIMIRFSVWILKSWNNWKYRRSVFISSKYTFQNTSLIYLSPMHDK